MKMNDTIGIVADGETRDGKLVGFEKVEGGTELIIFVPRRESPPPAPEAVAQAQVAVERFAKARELAPESFDAIAGPLDGDEETGPVEFELDLSALPGTEDLVGEPYRDASASQVTASTVDPEERLDRLLEPYSADSIAKARKLLERGLVVLAKDEPGIWWYNIQGSTMYVCKVTLGTDFLFAECSCPNGVHRGGDAICYHSIAARVAALDLAGAWLS